jgi:hypothetical protein
MPVHGAVPLLAKIMHACVWNVLATAPTVRRSALNRATACLDTAPAAPAPPSCSLYLKGTPADDVVLCTDTATYSVTLVESSNSLLLLEGLGGANVTAPAAAASGDGGDGESQIDDGVAFVVHGTVAGVHEVRRTTPYNAHHAHRMPLRPTERAVAWLESYSHQQAPPAASRCLAAFPLADQARCAAAAPPARAIRG